MPTTRTLSPRQSEERVVGQLDGLFGRAKRLDRQHGAENLLIDTLRAGRHVADDRRRPIPTVVGHGDARNVDVGALWQATHSEFVACLLVCWFACCCFRRLVPATAPSTKDLMVLYCDSSTSAPMSMPCANIASAHWRQGNCVDDRDFFASHLVERMADAKRVDASLQLFQEAIVDRLVHDQTRAGTADLSSDGRQA